MCYEHLFKFFSLSLTEKIRINVLFTASFSQCIYFIMYSRLIHNENGLKSFSVERSAKKNPGIMQPFVQHFLIMKIFMVTTIFIFTAQNTTPLLYPVSFTHTATSDHFFTLTFALLEIIKT
jgi:hypothetical protein